VLPSSKDRGTFRLLAHTCYIQNAIPPHEAKGMISDGKLATGSKLHQPATSDAVWGLMRLTLHWFLASKQICGRPSIRARQIFGCRIRCRHHLAYLGGLRFQFSVNFSMGNHGRQQSSTLGCASKNLRKRRGKSTFRLD
jgi:hypothetical protein